MILLDLYTVRNKIMSGVPIYDLKLRVTFYARVSTDKDEQLHSLSAQIVFFKDYITKNQNWEYIDGYIDEGISGTSVNKREDFLKMINDAKNNKFDLIVTKEISRFSRNTLDSIKYTQELLFNGVGVYFLNDNINTILPDSELRLTIMASVAQDEVRKLSERVHFGMHRSIDKGIVLGCSNIYGYIKNNGKLIVDENQAEMIKYIYENYANTTTSLSALAKRLEKKGYRNTKGNKIDIMVIQRIIQNPKYKGYYCGNKTRVIDYRTKKRKQLDINEWRIYKDDVNCPPIISEELWEKANNKLKKIKDSFKKTNQDSTVFQNRYTYSGKIFCSLHGTTFHRSSAGQRKNNPAWECKVYRKYGINGCDNSKIYEIELDKLFSNYIKQFIFDIVDNLINEYSEYFEYNNVNNDVLKIENKINNLNIKKDKMLELVLEGYMTKDDYAKKVKIINEDIINYKKKLDLFCLAMKDLSKDSKLKKLKESILIIKDDYNVYKELFNSLVKKIIVYKENVFNDKIKYSNKSKLEIYLRTNKKIIATSDNNGHKFHFLDNDTTDNSCKCSH